MAARGSLSRALFTRPGGRAGRPRGAGLAALFAGACALVPLARARAQPSGGAGSTAAPAAADLAGSRLVDRAVVRYYAPQVGGAGHPQFIFERELAFEARLEALGEGERVDPASRFLDRHVRAALERHVAEVLLARLPMDPEPSAAELAARTRAARTMIEQRVGGADRLLGAAREEGIGSAEIDELVRREARASLYLDRMVTPMLEPSDDELREVLRSESTPFRGKHFSEIAGELRKWYVAQRLNAAIASYFQNVRAKIKLTLLPAS